MGTPQIIVDGVCQVPGTRYAHLVGKFPVLSRFGIWGGGEKTMPYWTLGHSDLLTDEELWTYYGAIVPWMETLEMWPTPEGKD